MNIMQILRNASWKMKLASFGRKSHIYPYVIIHVPSKVLIGKRVAIAEFVHMWGAGGITIGDDVLIASHSVITSQTHDVNASIFRDTMIKKSVIIEDNVWIGSSAVILPGVKIGTGAVIGAGSVVTKDVLPNTVVVGVPARIIQKK